MPLHCIQVRDSEAAGGQVAKSLFVSPTAASDLLWSADSNLERSARDYAFEKFEAAVDSALAHSAYSKVSDVHKMHFPVNWNGTHWVRLTASSLLLQTHLL